MKCPYCGVQFSDKLTHCPNCKQPVSRAGRKAPAAAAPAQEPVERVRDAAVVTEPKRWMLPILIVLCVIALVFVAYKVYFQVYNYRLTRLYTRGALTPTVQQLRLSDDRLAHSIVYYGNDGEQIFIPELQRSYPVSGGIARITVADADWFDGDVTDIESANVKLSPILVSEAGTHTQLPALSMNIEVPDSPLTVISPARDNLNVVMSRYQLEIKVVPGSTVLLNGEDVTDMVNQGGILTQNVNVYPIGNNVYTIVVRTSKHHETRREITIYRPVFDIEVEIDPKTATYSETDSTTIKGTMEPGATLTVETPYVAKSLLYDTVTGQFSFIARLSSFGDNSVRFRVSKDGREDALVSLTVEYRPTEALYASKAWAMDYMELRKLYEQWHGQVFLCRGRVVDKFESDGTEYLVLDINEGGEEEQYLILENKSTVAKPTIGQRIKAYADVSGRRMYKDRYFPELIARYVYYLEG